MDVCFDFVDAQRAHRQPGLIRVDDFGIFGRANMLLAPQTPFLRLLERFQRVPELPLQSP